MKQKLSDSKIEIKKGHLITALTARPGKIPVIAGGKKPAYYHNEANRFGNTITISGSGASAGYVAFHNYPIYASDCSTITDSNDYNVKYLYYALLQQQDVIYRSQTGGAQPHIHPKDIAELMVNLPPLAEQQKIASILSDLDALIEAQEALIAKKKDVKAATMELLLTGKKRLPGFSDTWQLASFGDLFSIFGGHAASRDELSNNGISYLHYGDIHTSTQNYIDLQRESRHVPKLEVSLCEVSKGSILEHGDVVFVDASEDDDGTSKHMVIFNNENEPYISGLHTIVCKSKNEELHINYKRFCFRTESIKTQFRYYAVGTKVSGVSKTNLAKIKVTFPSKEEQAAITNILICQEDDLLSLTDELMKLEALKISTLHKLLTGEIRLD